MKLLFGFFMSLTLSILLVACSGSSGSNNEKEAADTDTPAVETDVITDTDGLIPADDIDIPVSGCKKMTFKEVTMTTGQSGEKNYSVVLNETLGDEGIADGIMIQFFTLDENDNQVIKEGLYDLGKAPNNNYATCNECILLFEDTTTEGTAKIYFQESGTLELKKVKEGTMESQGTITAKLVEVTIDTSNNYTSTPVENGSCIELVAQSWDLICVPQCDGKVCGPDGCGGSCGDGCGTKQCAADQKSCIDYQCTQLTIKEMLSDSEYGEDYGDIQGLFTENIGEAETDTLQIMFNGPQTKDTFNLAGQTTATCKQCIYLYQDVDAKVFFQQSGTLKLTEIITDADGNMTKESKGTITSLRVEEIAADASGKAYTVPGGACYEIATASWDTVCVPSCEGKICGSDGCGGTCGAGCGNDKQCAADQKSCVDFNCTKITVDAIDVQPDYADYGMLQGTFTANLGKADQDYLYLEFYDAQEKGTFDLANTNYKDCTQCVLIRQDIKADNSGIDKVFFQHSGTLTLDDLKTDTAGKMIQGSKGSLTSVRLVEVTVDSKTFESIPVAGGTCYDIETASWNTMP